LLSREYWIARSSRATTAVGGWLAMTDPTN
jgi:hypothetical protein